MSAEYFAPQANVSKTQ